MSIADTIGKKIINAIDSVAEYNRTQAELTRLRLIIKSETGRLNRAYITLGKEYCNKLKENGDTEHAELIETINSAEARINEVRERYYKIKNVGCSCDDEICDCEESAEEPAVEAEVPALEEKSEKPRESKKTPRKSIRTVIKKAEAKTDADEENISVEVKEIINDNGDILVDVVNTDGEVAEE